MVSTLKTDGPTAMIRELSTGEGLHSVVAIGPTTRKVFQSQALRYTALALVLPSLLAAPGQAGILVLHRHRDEPTHFHRSGHAHLDAWRDDHARQHSCEEPGHQDSHEPDAAADRADCDHGAPILVLTKEHLRRPLRSSDYGTPGQARPTSTAVAVLSAGREHDLMGGLPPPNVPRVDLAPLNATAALLLRNHALLL